MNRLVGWITWIGAGILGVLFWVLFVKGVMDFFSLPVVYVTWPDMECVAVQGGGDCDELPKKFEVVYVDPKWRGFTE